MKMRKNRKNPKRVTKVQRKKRKKKRKPIFLLILVVLLLSWAGYQVLQIGYKSLDTTYPVLTTYRESITGQGFLITKEKMVRAGDDGVVIFHAQEGEKIPVGHDIATVNLMKDTSGLKDKLIKIQSALDYKNNVTGPTEKDYKLSDQERNIIENIQQYVKEKDFNSLIGAINSLDLNTKHSVTIPELSDLLDMSIEELEAEKKELTKKISTNNLTYSSDFSGVVSYYLPKKDVDLSFDGDFNQYTYDKMKNLKIKQESKNKVKVKKDEPLFRVIDNLEWYVSVAIHDSKKLPKWEKGKVSVSLDDGELLQGDIIQINKNDLNSGVLIIQMDEGFDKNYKFLNHKAEVIRSSVDAFVLPNTCLVENKKVIGVYVQDLHGLVKFVPVKVLDEVNDSVYIQRGNQDDVIIEGQKEYKTIGINDGIVLNPGEVEEKQILK
ncbi:MAG: HlyD family efflux transporter periplasmic adaptor subunit [Tissierellia bacterium]|nr:HlyD family efflux transporter periplasmic adaptor subunit [Tissierellia bacterium]